MNNKELYQKLLGWFLLMLIIAMAFLAMSCEKQEPLIGIDHPADHSDTIPFILGCGNAKYHIEVEGWPTMYEPYNNATFYADVYVENGGEWYCIYYRRFTAHIWDDHELRYIGWGTVQDTNYVDYEHLNPKFIDLRPTL